MGSSGDPTARRGGTILDKVMIKEESAHAETVEYSICLGRLSCAGAWDWLLAQPVRSGFAPVTPLNAAGRWREAIFHDDDDRRMFLPVPGEVPAGARAGSALFESEIN